MSSLPHYGDMLCLKFRHDDAYFKRAFRDYPRINYVSRNEAYGNGRAALRVTLRPPLQMQRVKRAPALRWLKRVAILRKGPRQR